MNFPCANTAALNSFLKAQEDGERRAEMVEAETAALMADGEYKHDTAEHVTEALSEAGEADMKYLNSTMPLGAEAIGNAVLNISFGYWRALAKRKADENVTDAWNSCKCHGAGCRSCRADEE